jgi:hypothetical protein
MAALSSIGWLLGEVQLVWGFKRYRNDRKDRGVNLYWRPTDVQALVLSRL